MQIKSYICYSLCVISIVSCQEVEQNSTIIEEKIQSQTESNLDTEQNYLITKTELDSLLQSIEDKYNAESEVLGLLEESQKAWIIYRDVQILMKYPESDPLREGSAFNTCYFLYLTELTEQRIEILKPWLTGSKEGDVCSGTVLNQ